MIASLLSDLISSELIFGELSLLTGSTETVKNWALLLGLGALSGGILLMFSHKRHLDEILASDADSATQQFELRKYRRRGTSSALIASIGCMLAALYWVNEPKIFAAFIGLILLTLVAIFGLALADIFSVGIHSISRTDEPGRRAMIEEYLRQRKKQTGEEKEDK